MPKLIDITTTATLRPKILNHTLETFCNKMLTDKNRYRLIINIDPIGSDVYPKTVLAVAKKYFDNVVVNYPSQPCFTQAVIWCWSQVQADYVFHLEDDWELLVPIDIDMMIDILDKNKRMASLRLNKFKTRKNKCSLKHGFSPHPRLSLNPTLFNGSFIKSVYPLMTVLRNPEKQLRPVDNSNLSVFLKDWTHAIYTKQSHSCIVRDTGRLWMDNTQFKKKIGFLFWERKS